MFQRILRNTMMRVKFYDNGRTIPKYIRNSVEKHFDEKFYTQLAKKNRLFFFFFPIDTNQLLGYNVVAKYGEKAVLQTSNINENMDVRKTKKLFDVYTRRILKMIYPNTKFYTKK